MLTFTGMWNASFNLGTFIGPTAAGFMVEYWGFRNATLLFLFIYVIMFCVNLTDVLLKRSKLSKQKQNYEEIKWL